MKLIVTLEAEDEKAGKLAFEVDLPKKHFNILKESANLVASVTSAIQNIRSEFSKEE